MRKDNFICAIIIGFILCAAFASFAYALEYSSGLPKMIIFYSPGCHRCAVAKAEIMPEIEKEFKGWIEIEYRNINEMDNYIFLLKLQKEHNSNLQIELPVFYLEGHFLNGKADLRGGLKMFITQALLAPEAKKESAEINLVTRFKGFKPLVITGAGLIDGINPCAFTVIVFFISFLALQGYRKKELVIIGLSFIFAVFLTYIAIGLGLFGFLYELRGFRLAVKTVNLAIGWFSVFLGVLALYDFFKFKKTGKTEGLTLQLPQAVKSQIHKVIGLEYRVKKGEPGEGSGLKRKIWRLVISALVTGFLVSILEAICTGQVYLPTIVFVFKTTPLKLSAFLYLLLYNLMFVVPLFIIFIFALYGTTSEQFSQFLKKHLLTVKILMAALFLGLGAFLIWRP